jgi:hypothetical protein
MSADLGGALCVGKWWLFDSTDPADHREAAELCAECPVRAACAEFLQGERGRLGVPTGTWAGRLVGVKGRHEPRPIQHGTSNGYYQHRNRKEKACEPCMEAMRFDSWFRRRYGKVAA